MQADVKAAYMYVLEEVHTCNTCVICVKSCRFSR